MSFSPKIVKELNEAGCSDKYIKIMTPREAFDTLLNYEGIIGYTDQILYWLEETGLGCVRKD